MGDLRVRRVLNLIKAASTEEEDKTENPDKRTALRRLTISQLGYLAGDSSDQPGRDAVEEAYEVASSYFSEEELDTFMRDVRDALGDGKDKAESALEILPVLNDHFLGLSPDSSIQGEEGS